MFEQSLADPHRGVLCSPLVNSKPISHFSRGSATLAPEGQVGVPIPFTSGVRRESLHRRTSERGNPIVENMRAFRVGTFADSMGIVNTWESLHLEQMIFHFNYLRSAGIFVDVPLRADHSMSVQSVIGYIVAARLDPEDPDFLAVDVEFTEPEAYEKWNRGTYRARSLEVGTYRTNAGAEFTPTIFGLAFVDIPAVEGLYASNSEARFKFRQVIQDQEDSIVDPITRYCEALARWQQAYNAGRWDEAIAIGNEFGGEHGDALNAYTYARFMEAATFAQSQELPESSGDSDQRTPPTPPAPTPPANHAIPRPQVQAFRVNGVETTDYAAVQAHIAGLEQFRTETTRNTRMAQVEEFARDGKIAQPQVDSMKALVITMSDEQYEAFRSSYEAAPKMALLANHGAGQSQPGQPSNNSSSGDDDFELAKQIILNHQRAGKMTSEQIKATPTWARFAQMCTARNITPESAITL